MLDTETLIEELTEAVDEGVETKDVLTETVALAVFDDINDFDAEALGE